LVPVRIFSIFNAQALLLQFASDLFEVAAELLIDASSAVLELIILQLTPPTKNSAKLAIAQYYDTSVEFPDNFR